jgi:enoyl-CoA hydratase/carnithine racemase
VADLKKGSRVTGSERNSLAADLRRKYDSGSSIRSLAESTGRSYGFVHRILTESGAALRGRGGATRGKAKSAAPLRLNLTLSLPARHNAQSPDLWRALREIRRSVPGSVRVVVINGEGPSFSSGLDTRLLPALRDQPPSDQDVSGFQQGFDWTSDPAFVSIAAVHGHALGAGLQLALGCDLRIVTTDAVLAAAEVTLGLVPDLGGTGRLVSAVGYARALELAATGRRLTGREAQQIGLAQWVVEPDQLDSEVERLVTGLLAPDRDAAREIKALLLGAATGTRTEQLAAERAAQLRRLVDLRAAAEDGTES